MPVGICRFRPSPFDVLVERAQGRRRPTESYAQRPQAEGDTAMRFMVLVPANKESEAGVLPDEKILAEMGMFNEELVKAGVLLAGEGLQASSKGARIRYSGGKTTVIDGPFTESKELIAGFWLWQVKSMEEAVEWVKRCPSPAGAQEGEIEIRPVFETPDFVAEVKEHEAGRRAQSKTNTKQ